MRLWRWLLLAVVVGCDSEPAQQAPRPNLLLIVIDTARADHFSSYGYPDLTTPKFDAFARDAIRFERAYSTSTWTLAAHASLFTGLLPATHGATQEHLYLDHEIETLASVLTRAGYDTASFSNNSWISASTNLTRGFAHVDPRWKHQVPAEGSGLPHPTNRAVLGWIEQPRDRPFFVFVNYIEPHWPYDPPRRYRDRFVPTEISEGSRAASGFSAVRWYATERPSLAAQIPVRAGLYDADLSFADAILGELLDSLGALGHLDSSLVVVTSDHGENLGDNGHMGHSFSLYDSTVRVPLAIRLPGAEAAGSVRRDPVHLPDVTATLAAAAGVRLADPRTVGLDLLAGPLPEGRPLVAEYAYPKTFLRRFPTRLAAQELIAPFRRQLRAIRIGDAKLILGSDGSRELYDLRSDPREHSNRRDAGEASVRQLEQTLAELIAPLGRAPVPRQDPLDDAVVDHLRALGYVP